MFPKQDHWALLISGSVVEFTQLSDDLIRLEYRCGCARTYRRNVYDNKDIGRAEMILPAITCKSHPHCQAAQIPVFDTVQNEFDRDLVWAQEAPVEEDGDGFGTSGIL